MIPHAAPQAPPTIRPCGFTRRELRNLRATSGLKRPFKVRAWLLGETRLAKYGEPRVKRLAAAYSDAIQRCQDREAKPKWFAPDGGVCSYPV